MKEYLSDKKGLFFTSSIALILLAVFLLVQTVESLKTINTIGEGIVPQNTISVSGEGDVYAKPDIATFSFAVDETSDTVADAQTKVDTTVSKILSYLKSQDVADKDITTEDYSANPQYQNQSVACPPTPLMSGNLIGNIVISCPPSNPVIVGYEVSETISVKVEDLTKAGTVLAGVGTYGATDISSLSFSVSNQDDLNNQARQSAINQAKSKANTLANQLGVQLGRLVSFSESGNTPYPIMYAKNVGMAVASVPSAQIPQGQSETTSNVTLVYEIN